MFNLKTFLLSSYHFALASDFPILLLHCIGGAEAFQFYNICCWCFKWLVLKR